MYTINMILDIIVSAFLVVQSVICLPFNTVLFHFDAKASVFETGDDMYTVIWSTTLPGTGYVTYTYNGKEYTITDEENAAIRSTDTIHSVRIPKNHLNNNTYTYHSQQIGTKRAYVAVKGITISSKPIEFKGYNGQSEINTLVVSDIHENPYPALKAAKSFGTSPDVLAINGDAVSYMTSAIKLKQVLSYAYKFSNGSIPVIYTRGNHENRGEYGAESVNIFKVNNDGLYYTCTYGPIQFLALDSGEDKPDDDWTYSGLVNSTAYIEKETQWLNELTFEKTSEYKVCFAHMPYINDRYGFNWIEPLAKLNIDIFIGAHKHILNYEYSNTITAPFYQMIDGGKTDDNNYIATMLTFSGGNIIAHSNNKHGNQVGEYTYKISK